MNQYLSLVKFSHTIFALPFALIGYFLAVSLVGYDFEWTLLILVMLCMVFARSAAMGFNRFADRKIDQINPRTEKREIPAGVISAKSALIFVIVSSFLFIGTTYFINPLCFYLSPVALLLVLGYSYTKRFTVLSHFVLGLGLSLAPIGAYIAVTQEFDLIPVLFSFCVLFWVSGFDIIYALQDEEFDKSIGLKSIPANIGKKKSLILSTLLHIIAAGCLVFVGLIGKMGLFYWIGTSLFIILLAYQHTLVKPKDLSRINLAFFTTNGVASVVFAIFVILELMINQ